MEFIKELAEEYCVKNIPNLKDMHLTISTAFEAGFEKSQEWIMEELDKTLKALHVFQKWRRGANTQMPDPKDVGKTLDNAIKILRKVKKSEINLEN